MDKLQIESKFWRPLEKCDYGNSIFSFSSYVRQSKFLYLFLKRLYFFPSFDNCLSLIIYFPSSGYQSLNNFFNICLYKLFKFRPEIKSDEEEDEEKIMNRRAPVDLR